MPKQGKIDAYFRRSTFGEDARQKGDGLDKRNTLAGQHDITLQEFKEFSNVTELIIADIKQHRPERYHKELKRIDLYIEQVYRKVITNSSSWRKGVLKDLKFHHKPWLTKAEIALLREQNINPCYVNMRRNNFVPDFVAVLIKKSDRLHGIEAREKIKLNSGFYLDKLISENVARLGSLDQAINYIEQRYVNKYKDGKSIKKKDMSEEPCPLSKKHSDFKFQKPCPLTKKKYISPIETSFSTVPHKPCPLSKKKYILEIENKCSSVADNKPCPLSKKRRISNIVRPCSPISSDNTSPLPDKTSNSYSNDINTKKLPFDEISRQHCTVTSSVGTAPEAKLNKLSLNRKFDFENLPENNNLNRITHRNSPLPDNESNSYSNSSHAESYPTVINTKTRKFIAIEKTVEPDDFSNLNIIKQSDLLKIIKSRYPYLSKDDKHIVLEKYLKAVLFNFDTVKKSTNELEENGSKRLGCKLSSKTSEHKSKNDNENVAVNYPWPSPKLLTFSDLIKYTNVEDYLRADIMRRFPKDHKKYLKHLPKCIKNFYKKIFLVKNEWPPGLKFNTSDLKEFYAAKKHNVHNNNNIIIEPSTCKQVEHLSHRSARNNSPQRELLIEDNLPKNVSRNQETNAPVLIGSCSNEEPRQSEENLEDEHNSEGNRSEVLCHNLEKFLTESDTDARKESTSNKTSTKANSAAETEILNKDTVQREKSKNDNENVAVNYPWPSPKLLSFSDLIKYTNVEDYLRADIMRRFPKDHKKYLKHLPKCIKNFYKNIFLVKNEWPPGLKFNTSDLKEFYAAKKHNVHNNNNIIIEPSTCKQDDHSSHKSARNNSPQRELLIEDNLPRNVPRNQEINAPMDIGSCTNEDPNQSQENLEDEHNSEGNRSEVLCHNLEKFLTESDKDARKESTSNKTSTKANSAAETEILNKDTVQREDTTACNIKPVHQKTTETVVKLQQNLIKPRNHIVLDRVTPKSLTFDQFKERTNIEEYIRKDILKKFPETSKKYLPKMQKLIERFYKKFFIKFPIFPEGLVYIPIRNKIITTTSNETNALSEKNKDIEDNDETMMILSDPDNGNLDPSDSHVNIIRPTEPSQDLFSCSDKSQNNDIIFVSCRDRGSQVPLALADPLNIPEYNVIHYNIIEKNNAISLPRCEDFEDDVKNVIAVDKVLNTDTDKNSDIMTEIHEDIVIKQEDSPISLSYQEDVEIILRVTPPPIVIEDSLVDADDYLAQMLLNSQDTSRYDENNIVLQSTSVPSEQLNLPIEISTSNEQRNNDTDLGTCNKTNQDDSVRNKNLTLEINSASNIDLSKQNEHRSKQADSHAYTNPQSATLLNSCNINRNNSSFDSKSTSNEHESENNIEEASSQQNDAQNNLNKLSPDEQNTSLSVFRHMTATKTSKELSLGKISKENLCKNILEATENSYKCIENNESNYCNKKATALDLNVINIENMPENTTTDLNVINTENIPEIEPETTSKLQIKPNKIPSLDKEEHPTSSTNKNNNYKVYSNRRLNVNVQKPNPIKQLEDVGVKNQTTTIAQDESCDKTKETTQSSSKFIDNKNCENNQTKKSSVEVVPIKKRPKLVEEVEIPSKRRKMAQQSKKKCKEKGENSDRLDEAVSNTDLAPQRKHNFGPLALIQKKINCIPSTENFQGQASIKTKQKSDHSSNEDPDYRIDDSSQISISQFLNSDNTYFTDSPLEIGNIVLFTEKKGLTSDKSVSPARMSTESIPTSTVTRAVTLKINRECPERAENIIIKLLKPIRPPTQFQCITYLEISKIVLNSKSHRMHYNNSIPFIQQFEKHPLQTILNVKSHGFRQLKICGSCVRLLLGFTVREWSCVDNDEEMITFNENLDADMENLDASDNHNNILRPILPSQNPFSSSSDKRQTERFFVSCGDCESQVQLSVIEPKEKNVIRDSRIEKNDISLHKNEHFHKEADHMDYIIGSSSVAEAIITDTDMSIGKMIEIHEDISTKQECSLISSFYNEDTNDYLAEMLLNTQDKSQYYDENNIALSPTSVPYELLNAPIEISTNSEQQNNETEIDISGKTDQVDLVRNKNLKLHNNPENNIDLSDQPEHSTKQSNSVADPNLQACSNHKVYYNLRLSLNVQKPNVIKQAEEDVGVKDQTTMITQNESYDKTKETTQSSSLIDNSNSENNEAKKLSIEVVHTKKRPKLVEEVEKPLKRTKIDQLHKICNENGGNFDEGTSNKDFVSQTKPGLLAVIQKKIDYIATTDSNSQEQTSNNTKQKSVHSSTEDPDYHIDDSSEISISQFLNTDNTYFTGSQLGSEERILTAEKALTPDKSVSPSKISTESTPTSSFTSAHIPKTYKKCPEPAENRIINLLKPIRPSPQFGCITYLAIRKIILNSKINRIYYDSSIPFLQPFEKQPLQATVNFKSNGFRQLNICGSSVRLLLGFTAKELSCVIKILKLIDTFKYEPRNPEPANESLPYRILYYLFKTIPKFSQVYFEYEDNNINYVKCVSVNNNNTTSFKPISCLTKVIDNDILDEIKKLKQKLDS